MSYGQPTDPRAQSSNAHDYPQQLWPDYAQVAGQQRPGVPAPAPSVGSAVFGVLALIVGLAALVAPFLPMDMTSFRQYVALPIAVPGLVLATVGLIGTRRGKPAAAIGLILSALAFLIGAYMLITFR